MTTSSRSFTEERVLPGCWGLPGTVHAGEPAEGDGLLLRQLAGPGAVVLVLPEEAEVVGAFAEAEVRAALKLRREDFEPVEVIVFGHFHDSSRSGEAFDVRFPLLGLGPRHGRCLLEVGDEIAKRSKLSHADGSFLW